MSNNKYPSIPTSIDIDSRKIKMGFKTAVSIAIFIVTITVGAVTFGVNMVSRADVDEALIDHSKTIHRDQFGKPVSAPYSVVDTASSNKEEITSLKSRILSIESKIDFIIEIELIKSQNDPSTHSAMKKAANRIRKKTKKANMKEDPFTGIEGL
jgi:hypothetical protein